MGKTKIWSLRRTVAKGLHYVLERECSAADAAAWIKIFQKDEPAVTFTAALRKPGTQAA